MSNLRNSVQLIGHLGADPETKTLESGKMTKLRLATTESYKAANGEWRDETQWHNIMLWEALADRAGKQLTKGSFLLLQGKLVNRSYTDTQGVKKYITEVRATNFIALDKTKTTALETFGAAAQQDDGLPF